MSNALEIATNNRIFLFLAGLSFKAALAVGTSISGIFGVIIGELFTNQWGAAGLAGAVAACVGAFFVFIPRYMEQRRKNVLTFSEVKEKEMTSIISRLTDISEKELAFYKLQVSEAWFIVSLERGAKHTILSELTAAQTHNQILTQQIKQLGHTPLIELHSMDYETLRKDIDEKILQIREQAVDTAKIAVKTTLLTETVKATVP